ASPERRLDALRGLADRVQSSVDAVQHQRQDDLRLRNCAFIATLHNATTDVQRAKARETAQGYAADLRALAATAE
ncbi:MAG: hypothetical protein M3Y32_00570, partial [Pseudomonadota bacterium]|nr:hypothetical protein [Pseudomonadota bacterium]